MNYQTIDEIYSANKNIRTRLQKTVETLTDSQLNFRVDENSWTIQEIIEHLAIVESGIAKLCVGLLEKSRAENIENTGDANISESGKRALNYVVDRVTRKVEAPERVVPTGKLSIDESFAKINQTAEILNGIQHGLETVNTEKFKFPHPFFGDLSATEWLALIGGHEKRHIDQIEEILAKQ